MNEEKSLRLASINIEGERHLEEVLNFLQEFKPDVVCFQEIIDSRVSYFEEKLQMKGLYLPMVKDHVDVKDLNSPIGVYGVGLFTSLNVVSSRQAYYYGDKMDLQMNASGDESVVKRGFIEAVVLKAGARFTIATTHFTRTPDGSTSDKQREDLKNLLSFFKDGQELILCGDFNAPRGEEIFGNLAQIYTDNIPGEYDSSLDSKLHRVGHLKLMVDVLFSTRHYKVTDAKLSEGVSDHKAISAVIFKN